MNEKKPEPSLSLARTKVALDAYDLAEAAYQACVDAGPTVSEVSGSHARRATEREINEYNDRSLALLNAVEMAGVKVGQAFAEDTADRNARDTAVLVRPDAWLRRLVAQWEAEEAGMNDGDKIDKKALDELVITMKTGEANRINGFGIDAQIAYLLSGYTADDLREAFENPFGVVTRQSAVLAAIERLSKPAEPLSADSGECLDDLLVRFEHVPEIHDQVHILMRLLSVIDKLTVECKVCHKTVPARTAHRYQGELVGDESAFVGDECCWDERLRTTE